jgi:HEAT repeat protein
MVTLLLSVVVLAVAAWISTGLRPEPALPPLPAVAVERSNDVPESRAQGRVGAVPAVATAIAANGNGRESAVGTADHEELVRRRTVELDGLAMEKSPAAHQTIVSELNNPDRFLRQAALEALMQANDRSVIPQMRQMADQTTDSDERKAILDAIDYINLPSLTEYLHQHEAREAARDKSAGTDK